MNFIFNVKNHNTLYCPFHAWLVILKLEDANKNV